MKRSAFLTSLGVALLVVPVLVLAQTPEPQGNRVVRRRQIDGQPGPGQMGPMGQGGPMMKPRRDIKAELGLTDAQQADIRKVMEGARRDRLRKSTDLKIARLDLRSLLRADKVDDKAIAAKVAEAQAAQGALLKLRVDTALAMKRILTPEQQKKIAEMRQDRGRKGIGQRMKMRGMMRRGGGMGPMPGMNDDGSGLDFDLNLDLDDEADSGTMLHGDNR
jgi:Spy/CpxP family protein refolding chaperone